jgi:hypothetical protein
LASLPTALRLHREAAHPNFGIIFDCYHFWAGPSRLEDMERIRPGEILHAHINDTPEMPRELLDLQSREIFTLSVASHLQIESWTTVQPQVVDRSQSLDFRTQQKHWDYQIIQELANLWQTKALFRLDVEVY